MNSDLNGANLRGANFTDANLAGAQMSESWLFDNGDLVIWNNTICPDGTNSDDNGGTCNNT